MFLWSSVERRIAALGSTRRRIGVVVPATLAFVLLVGALAFADDLAADGDFVTAGNQATVDFGTVCSQNLPVARNVELWVVKGGGPGGGNRYSNGASVAVTITTSPLPSNLSASTAVGTITLPTDWESSSVAAGTASAKVTSTVTLGSGVPVGPFSATLQYNATEAPPIGTTPNKNQDVAVSANIVNCNTAPSLQLPVDKQVEATGPTGATVTYVATASDVQDGTLTPSCTPPSGSVFPLGSTQVTCSVIDSGGLHAGGSFQVTVVDTTPPTLTVPEDMTVEATSAAGAVVTYTVVASDIVDGPVAAICSLASGAQFPLGATTVGCTATDTAGNGATASFRVTVVDTTPPTLTVPADMTVEATSAAGAVVTYTVVASDIVDGPVAAICAPASGAQFPLGATTVGCTATDTAGNSATASFQVTVVDTTPPTLTIPAGVTAYAAGGSVAVVTYAASAFDIVDGVVPVTCAPASGSSFSVGTTTVGCSATDAAGNTATGSFTVTVRYRFAGFFRPVDNPSVVNVVKAGSAVPVKFSLGGYQGLDIFLAGSPSSSGMACQTGVIADAIEETLTAGGSSLSYDPATDQYTYVWKTAKSWGGTCRQLQVRLADGTLHVANFNLTK